MNNLFYLYDQIGIFCNVYFHEIGHPGHYWTFSVTWKTDSGEYRNSNVGDRTSRKDAEVAVLELAAKIAEITNRKIDHHQPTETEA